MSTDGTAGGASVANAILFSRSFTVAFWARQPTASSATVLTAGAISAQLSAAGSLTVSFGGVSQTRTGPAAGSWNHWWGTCVQARA
jgi:hypothetical protein